MKKIAICLAMLSVAILGAAISSASDTDTVSCTATFTQLGVTVSPNNYDFGFGQANDWSNTSGGYFEVQNTGNNNEKIYIEASADAGNTWTLAATNGENQAVMKCLGGDLTSWTSIHTQQTLKSNLASGATVDFDLAFQFPSSTTTYDTQYFTVTVTAVAAS